MTKLLLPAMVVALLAAALPAAASAASMSYEDHSLVGTGTEVNLNMNNFEIDSAWGHSDCYTEGVSLSAYVTKNSNSTVRAGGEGSSNCSLSEPVWWANELRTILMGELTAEGSEGTGTMSLAFTTNSSYIECEWAGSLDVSFKGETDSFSVSGTVESLQCGEAEIHAKFSVEDSSEGSAVLLNRGPGTAFVSESEGTSSVQLSAKSMVLWTEFGVFSCYNESASTSLNETADTLGFGMFGGCEYNARNRGCELVLHVGDYEGNGASSGTADIACPAGREVEIELEPAFIIGIPPQTDLQGVAFESVEGEPGEVIPDIDLTELAYRFNGEDWGTGTLKAENVALSATEESGNSTGLSVDFLE